MTGESLLHYRLLAKLGEGGMAEVYRAQDTRLGRTVALKVLPTRPGADPKLRHRFLREAKAAAALSHPNIVSIYEIGSERDIDFIAMELVEGQPLSKLLRAGKLSIPDVLSYSAQIASAMAKAHAAGVVHRDLKPSNAMVTSDGLVKLLDFGLAQVNTVAAFDKEIRSYGLGGPSRGSGRLSRRAEHRIQSVFLETVSRITESGVLLGTYAYMSPEQARAEPVDQRSDVFSFGVMLYEMLAGTRPFDAPNTVEMLHKTMYFTPPPVQNLRADVPAALATIVDRCLQKDRAARFQSMEPVADALRSMQRALDSNPGVAKALLAPPNRHRRRYVWAAAAVAAVGLAGGAWQAMRKGGLAAAIHLPSPAADLNRQGQSYLLRFDRAGNADKAIQSYQQALALERNSASAYAGLGMAYSQKYADNPDPQWLRVARSNAAEALRLNSLLALSHVSMGRAALVGKDFPQAEKEFRRALELEPNNADAQLNLGQSLVMQRHPQEAEAAYHKVIETQPGDWRAYHFLGGLLYSGGRYQEAEAAFVKAGALAPDNVAVYKIQGATYHMLDRDADAAEVLQKALLIRRSSQILSNLGSIYFYLGRYQDAAEAYRGALDEKGANNYHTWGNLGLAYRFSGYAGKAADAYREGIRLLDEQLAATPDNIRLRAALALYLAALRQKERALQEIERTRKLPRPDAESLFDIGLASELAGRRDAALKLLAQSVKAGYALRQIQIHPDLVALRSDPGYHLLLLSKPPGEK